MTAPFDLTKTSESFRRLNADVLGPPAPATATPPTIKIRQRHAPKLNATEVRLLDWLRGPHAIGERIYAQAVTIELGNGCTYRPDFFVPMLREKEGGGYESLGTFYEAKGRHTWEDALIKLRWATKEYPCFTFFLCWEQDGHGHWKTQKVLP